MDIELTSIGFSPSKQDIKEDGPDQRKSDVDEDCVDFKDSLQHGLIDCKRESVEDTSSINSSPSQNTEFNVEPISNSASSFASAINDNTAVAKSAISTNTISEYLAASQQMAQMSALTQAAQAQQLALLAASGYGGYLQAATSGKPLANMLSGMALLSAAHSGVNKRGRGTRTGSGGSSPRGNRRGSMALKLKRLESGEFVRTNSRGRGIRNRRKTGGENSFNSDYYYYYMNEAMAARSTGGSAVVSSVGGINSATSVESTSPSRLDYACEVYDYGTTTYRDDIKFTEKFPGHLCAFCNLSERSMLGQGEIVSCRIPSSVDLSELLISAAEETEGTRKLATNSRIASSEDNGEPLDDLDCVGFTEIPERNTLGFEDAGLYYVHSNCVRWSKISPEAPSDTDVVNLIRSRFQRCHYCGRFGASLVCRAALDLRQKRIYHWPCAVASGCYLNKLQMIFISLDFLYRIGAYADGVMYLYHTGESWKYGRVCDLSPEKFSNLLGCTVCGQHYYYTGTYVKITPVIRAGWQCQKCKWCQLCRQSNNEERYIVCDVCDGAFHGNCVRPHVMSVSKHGWKCKRCRKCNDCGSKTPGSGHSSRWHVNYTVCDSCYQHRNKGQACSCCGRAYRHSAQKDMLHCSLCKRYIHSHCEAEASEMAAAAGQSLEIKPLAKMGSYVCPVCRGIGGGSRYSAKIPPIAVNWDSSEDGFDESGSIAGTNSVMSRLGKGKPMNVLQQNKKKRFGYSSAVGRSSLGFRLGGWKTPTFAENKIVSSSFTSPSATPTTSAVTGVTCGKKKRTIAEAAAVKRRIRQPKLRGMVGLQGPQAEPGMKEDPEEENKMICVSVQDDFVLKQDLCVMCGSFGNDQEGRLIVCTQCGQCYHPYCVSVQVTKVILQKGWRCLDCTVCEGCGLKHDEANLILCDECDISYHIYCIDPPLEDVPQGTWKCKWCANCQMCGSGSPGLNSVWFDNYSVCGPCHSLSQCLVCDDNYEDDELIIKCSTCLRWNHAECDSILSELEAKQWSAEYVCPLCRPPDMPPPHLVQPEPSPQFNIPISQSPAQSPKYSSFSISPFLANASYVIDGIVLSEMGMASLKELTIEKEKPRRKRRNGSEIDNSNEMEDITVDEDDDSMMPPPIGGGPKDGDIVIPSTDGKPPEAPEGFTVMIKETGVMVLKKKRCRDLKKVGIGGFQVKTRTPNRKQGGKDDMVSSSLDDFRPKKRPFCKSRKNTLLLQYPDYIQDSFFGREFLDSFQPSQELLKMEELESHGDASSDIGDDDTAAEYDYDLDWSTIQLGKENLADFEKIKRQEKQTEAEEASSIKQEIIIKTEPLNNIEGEVTTNGGVDGLMPGDEDLLPSDIFGDDLFSSLMDDQGDDPSTINDDAIDDKTEGKDDGTLSEASGRSSRIDGVTVSCSNTSVSVTEDNQDHALAEAMRDALGPEFKIDSKEFMADILKDMLNSNEDSTRVASSSAAASNSDSVVSNCNLVSASSTTLVPLPSPGDANSVQYRTNPIMCRSAMMNESVMITNEGIHHQQETQLSASLQPQTVMNQTQQDAAVIRLRQQQLIMRQHADVQIQQQIQMQRPASMMIVGDTMQVQQRPLLQQFPPPSPSPVVSDVTGYDRSTHNYSQPHAEYIHSSPQQSPMMSPSPGGFSTEHARQLVVTGDISQPSPVVSSMTSSDSNQKSQSIKWAADEPLGENATIAMILHANKNHPNLKNEVPIWSDRLKQINKLWKVLPTDKRAPFVQQARENRTASRMNRHTTGMMSSGINAASPNVVVMASTSSACSSIPPPTPALISSIVPSSEFHVSTVSSSTSIQEQQWKQIQQIRQQQQLQEHQRLQGLSPPASTGSDIIAGCQSSVGEAGREQLRYLLQRGSASGVSNNPPSSVMSTTIVPISMCATVSSVVVTAPQFSTNAIISTNTTSSTARVWMQGADASSGITNQFRQPLPPGVRLHPHPQIYQAGPSRPVCRPQQVQMFNSRYQQPNIITSSLAASCSSTLSQRAPLLDGVVQQQINSSPLLAQQLAGISSNSDIVNVNVTCAISHSQSNSAATTIAGGNEEIPQSVSDELDQLEASAVVGGGGEDDLLGMGDDFNILEFADALDDGDTCKTTILDDFQKPKSQEGPSATSGVSSVSPPPYPAGRGPPPPYPGHNPNLSTPKEQPLLLEDLVEQEKREQQQQNPSPIANIVPGTAVIRQSIRPVSSVLPPQSLVRTIRSDTPKPPGDECTGVVYGDFNRVRASNSISQSPRPLPPGAALLQNPGGGYVVVGPVGGNRFTRPTFNQWQPKHPQEVTLQQRGVPPQQLPLSRPPITGQYAVTARRQGTATPPVPSLININPPAQPPTNPQTDEDRQKVVAYEEWLVSQEENITRQLNYYETEINKLRKQKKSMSTRQRTVRKNGGELSEIEQADLDHVTSEALEIQKVLDRVRKQSRQHSMIISDYRSKTLKPLQNQLSETTCHGPNEHILVNKPSLNQSLDGGSLMVQSSAPGTMILTRQPVMQPSLETAPGVNMQADRQHNIVSGQTAPQRLIQMQQAQRVRMIQPQQHSTFVTMQQRQNLPMQQQQRIVQQQQQQQQRFQQPTSSQVLVHQQFDQRIVRMIEPQTVMHPVQPVSAALLNAMPMAPRQHSIMINNPNLRQSVSSPSSNAQLSPHLNLQQSCSPMMPSPMMPSPQPGVTSPHQSFGGATPPIASPGGIPAPSPQPIMSPSPGPYAAQGFPSLQSPHHGGFSPRNVNGHEEPFSPSSGNRQSSLTSNSPVGCITTMGAVSSPGASNMSPQSYPCPQSPMGPPTMMTDQMRLRFARPSNCYASYSGGKEIKPRQSQPSLNDQVTYRYMSEQQQLILNNDNILHPPALPPAQFMEGDHSPQPGGGGNGNLAPFVGKWGMGLGLKGGERLDRKKPNGWGFFIGLKGGGPPDPVYTQNSSTNNSSNSTVASASNALTDSSNGVTQTTLSISVVQPPNSVQCSVLPKLELIKQKIDVSRTFESMRPRMAPGIITGYRAGPRTVNYTRIQSPHIPRQSGTGVRYSNWEERQNKSFASAMSSSPDVVLTQSSLIVTLGSSSSPSVHIPCNDKVVLINRNDTHRTIQTLLPSLAPTPSSTFGSSLDKICSSANEHVNTPTPELTLSPITGELTLTVPTSTSVESSLISTVVPSVANNLLSTVLMSSSTSIRSSEDINKAAVKDIICVSHITSTNATSVATSTTNTTVEHQNALLKQLLSSSTVANTINEDIASNKPNITLEAQLSRSSDDTRYRQIQFSKQILSSLASKIPQPSVSHTSSTVIAPATITTNINVPSVGDISVSVDDVCNSFKPSSASISIARQPISSVLSGATIVIQQQTAPPTGLLNLPTQPVPQGSLSPSIVCQTPRVVATPANEQQRQHVLQNIHQKPRVIVASKQPLIMSTGQEQVGPFIGTSMALKLPQSPIAQQPTSITTTSHLQGLLQKQILVPQDKLPSSTQGTITVRGATPRMPLTVTDQILIRNQSSQLQCATPSMQTVQPGTLLQPQHKFRFPHQVTPSLNQTSVSSQVYVERPIGPITMGTPNQAGEMLSVNNATSFSSTSLNSIRMPSPQQKVSPSHSVLSTDSEYMDGNKRTAAMSDAIDDNSDQQHDSFYCSNGDLSQKNIKRRLSQQQRRKQCVGGNKDSIGGISAKKRPRKGSKVEETDYDGFIDSVMHQLKSLPSVPTMEPKLNHFYSACPPFGSGKMPKMFNFSLDTLSGSLNGEFGYCNLKNEGDYYCVLPFGLDPPVPYIEGVNITSKFFYKQEFGASKALSGNLERPKSPEMIYSSSPEPDAYEDNARTRKCKKYIWKSDSMDDDDFDSDDDDVEGYDSEDAFLNGDDYEHATYRRCRSPQLDLVKPITICPKGGQTITMNDLKISSSSALQLQKTNGITSAFSHHLKKILKYDVTKQWLEEEINSRNNIYKTKDDCEGKDSYRYINTLSVITNGGRFCSGCHLVLFGSMVSIGIQKVLPLLTRQRRQHIVAGLNDVLYFCENECYFKFMATPVRLTEAGDVCNFEDLKKYQAKLEEDTKEGLVLRNKIKKEKDEHDEGRTTHKDHVSTASFKHWKSTLLTQRKHKKMNENELTQMMLQMGLTMMPPRDTEDIRECLSCRMKGDAAADGPARLLNYDVNKWIHLNCALWPEEVYETVSGALVNVETSLKGGSNLYCKICEKPGATIRCWKLRCTSYYHVGCAAKDGAMFYKNKSVYCNQHILKSDKEQELTTLSVYRRVYIDKDENRQVAKVMTHGTDQNIMRIGSLIFLSVGQLLPHQLHNFHNQDYIYPIGYKVLRYYWSITCVNKRCGYVCSINEVNNKPEFRVTVREGLPDERTFVDVSARGVWLQVLKIIEKLRKEHDLVKVFPKYITGEDLFGLQEPNIVKVLESLPGVESLSDYTFKYGRNPLLELPLAVNPTGCARSEPKLRTHVKRVHNYQRTTSSSTVSGGAKNSLNRAAKEFLPTLIGLETTGPYSKNFVQSKSSQYRKMRQEWRQNVVLARSRIQGLGLYAARDIERHQMIIEYIGEIIRSELTDIREKRYEDQNRGIYMFRLNDECVLDATMCGGMARYINHSCNPNCVTETVEVDRDLHIIIFANQRISRGEELSYDYKFDFEDENKIPCACGASNCRKWMN